MAHSKHALLRSAESFAAKLDPPGAPSLCPACFFRFCAEVDTTEGAAVCLQMNCHAFWAAVVGFISEQWTPSAEEAVTTRLEQTRRGCRSCPAIDTRILRQSMFAVVYSAACRALGCALDSRFKASTKGFADRLGRWPMSTDQLFPHGAERTICSLLYHTASAKGGILSVLVALVIVHRPLVFPLLLQDKYRTQLLTCIIKFAEELTSGVQATLSALPQPVPPALRDTIARAYLGPKLPMFLLNVLGGGPGSSLSDHSRVTCGWEAQLFSALDALLRFLEGPVYLDDERAMKPVRKLWDALSEPQRRALGYGTAPPPYLAGGPDMAALLERFSHDPYGDLYCILRLHRQLTQMSCGAPACEMRPHDKATPGAFSLCGRCRFVRYCSRACQKAAWKDPDAPHKAVCDLLHELFAFATLDVGLEQFARVCRDRAFPFDSAGVLLHWAGTHVAAHDGKSLADWTTSKPE